MTTSSMQPVNARWVDVLWQHAQTHPAIASGLLVAFLLVIALVGQSLFVTAASPDGKFVYYALLGGTAGFIATALGALPALVLRNIPHAIEDCMLGFAAGMMLAASAFSLLLPGIEAGTEIMQSAT